MEVLQRSIARLVPPVSPSLKGNKERVEERRTRREVKKEGEMRGFIALR